MNLRALCVLRVRRVEFQREKRGQQNLALDHRETPTIEADHTEGDPCATGHSPRSNPQRRRIDRPRSAIDRDQTTAGPDWPEPALPLPGLVRSNPYPAGPLRSRHLHLRRSLHGRSPRASVVVLHCGAKKEISRILTGASQDCQGFLHSDFLSAGRLEPCNTLKAPHKSRHRAIFRCNIRAGEAFTPLAIFAKCPLSFSPYFRNARPMVSDRRFPMMRYDG